MLATALIAASVLAPSGTATIQADPVCLPVMVQPGHSYGFTITASSGNLAVVPDRLDAAPLNQVRPSWVIFGPSSGILAIPRDAAPGPYQSLIKVTAPGGAGQVSLGAAATTALVFTVGPSDVPPPPCDALDLAQSTGKFPAWPTKAFATTGWKQVFAEEQRDNPKPVTSPTAGTGAPAPAAAPAYSPAASSSGSGKTHLPGWVWVAAIAVVLILLMARRKK
jgi:hypothetical protein